MNNNCISHVFKVIPKPSGSKKKAPGATECPLMTRRNKEPPLIWDLKDYNEKGVPIQHNGTKIA